MKQTPDISTPDKVKPNTPQKYGHARRVVPIRRRIWQKVALRWIIMLAIGVAILLLTLISNPLYHSTRNRQIGMGMSIILYVIILWRTRIFPYTFSKEWTGKVVDREVVKYTKFGKSPFDRRVAMATKCVWTVQTDDGYIEKIPCDTEEIWERYFDIGERVRFYKNAKILVKAHPQRDDENLMCPLCGVMVIEPICKKCGVDFTEKEEQ